MTVLYSGSVLDLGINVLREEAQSILDSIEKLDNNFNEAVSLLASCSGRVVVTGVGKSGHIGRKIAATLASTGTASFFVHAGEAGHGDLGMITGDDVLVAISNSGDTDEVVNFVSFAKRNNVKSIGITGNTKSEVARLTDCHIDSGVKSEACPLGVAPTSSTTVQLALGDALAMACLAFKGFTTEDYAKTHPFGSLGRRYFIRIRDVMQPIKDIPNKPSSILLKEALPSMAIGRMGALLLIDKDNNLEGIFTDSDLRRLIVSEDKRLDQKLNTPISEFMIKNPTTIEATALASEALNVFEHRKISRIVCLEKSKVVGIIGWHNLLENKIK